MSAKVLQKVLLVSMCLMLMAFVFPQTVLATEHTLEVHDYVGPCEGVYCKISILTGTGWQHVWGWTDENGLFQVDEEEHSSSEFWTWEILEPLHLQGPVDVEYDQFWDWAENLDGWN